MAFDFPNAPTINQEFTPSGGPTYVWNGTIWAFKVPLNADPFTTGDVKITFKTTPDLNWVIMDDGTIGDATSGSSNRANSDTLPLFSLFYNFTDTFCPLLTSAGGATTRAAQGTVATAFANHCRLTLPRALGRSLAVAGAGAGLTARTLGGYLGEESHTMTTAEMVAHNHGVSDPSHAHSVYDPGHAHSVGDPGHGHNVYAGDWSLLIVASGSGATLAGGADVPYNNMVGQTTGAGTGIGIYGAGTGISVQNAGSSSPMNVMQPTTFINIMVHL